MEQKSKYEIEIENFRRIFNDKKDKRIAVYGMGRRSATLLPGITDYNIIGLLDRDESNIGKELCGIKVVSIRDVDNIADMIIINSDPSNYEIIFKRIADYVNIPVYYSDGTLAELTDNDKSYENNPYWNSSYEELKKKIDESEVVSFDIFDTLIMRRIFSPEDVFRLLGEEVHSTLSIDEDIDIAGIRAKASSSCNVYASIDDIYTVIQSDCKMTDEQVHDTMKLEFNIDKRLCVQRKEIVELYDYSISKGKSVYLISDMYYTKDYIKELLSACNINLIDDDNIWISCEINKDKITGSMWEEYANIIGTDRKCIHIGDNIKGDVYNPQSYGIDAYYIMSAKDMLMNSSAAKLAPCVNTVQDSVCMGIVNERLFNNPFVLNVKKGRITYTDAESYGYCVYGPLLEKFLLWLYYNSRKDSVDKLLFFARDGYFLEKDYKMLVNLLNDESEQDCCYLPISRRLIYLATLENEDDLKRVLAFPYVGTFAEYMKSRFGIEVSDDTKKYNNCMINAVGDSDKIYEWIEPYKEKIYEEAAYERTNYLRYLHDDGDMKNDYSYGTVDLGYYGTNQYYLQKLTGIKTKGYCLYCRMSDDNVYINELDMKGCFQYVDDYTAEKSIVKKKNMYVETFLTAPHGMVRYVDDEGKIVCEPDRKSQLRFEVKERVNDGIADYINNYIYICKNTYRKLDGVYQDICRTNQSVEDMVFCEMLGGMADVSNEILDGFYFDNDFVGGKEVKLEV